MSAILKMPRLGETMEQGTLAAWLVEPGKPFKRGDPLLEVETDKTLVEFPALGDGILIESLIELGDIVLIGTPIARIDIGDGPDWTRTGDEEVINTEEEATVDDTAKKTRIEIDEAHATSIETPPGSGAKIRATPQARRAARNYGIDLSTLFGSGRRGRIELKDVTSASISAPAGMQSGHGITWLEMGSGSGPIAILLHGFAADHTAWSGLQSQLARSGMITAAVDLPSHGTATAKANDTSELSKPLIEMAEANFGRKPLHIIAHSMGAIPAMALAKSRPTASITLIAPAGVGHTIDTMFLNELSSAQSLSSVTRALDRITRGPTGLSDVAIQEIFKTLQQGRLKELAKSIAGASGQAVDIRKELVELAREIPVSILLGHRDQIINWAEALDISPLINTHHFMNVGHMPHWEALSDVLQLITRKLQS